jgi:hypothetical protein
VSDHPEVFWFDNTIEGLQHFVKATGIKVSKMPSPEKAEAIKKEEQQLPPLGWLDEDSLDVANAVARRAWHQWDRRQFYQMVQPVYVPDELPTPPPPEKKEDEPAS